MPDYRKATRRAARKFGVDPQILQALVKQESGFNPRARSPAGAQGIAQFIPSTAKAYGVNLHDGRVTDDLEGAARYIRDNLKRTGGDYRRALSIYNSGRPEGYKSIPETRNYVAAILGSTKGQPKGPEGGTGAGTASRGTRKITTRQVTPGVDRSSQRAQAVLAYLNDKGSDSLDLALNLKPLQDTPGSTVTTTRTVRTPGSRPGGSSDTSALRARASAIDRKRLPYKWGGGHAGRVNAYKAQPLDCSGAVSAVLGINPRVSGQFTKWGKPGRAPGGRGVTVYANAKHVLMEIDGHFFGTSKSNPGGGAGWIPRGQVSPGYLRGFVARHG